MPIWEYCLMTWKFLADPDTEPEGMIHFFGKGLVGPYDDFGETIASLGKEGWELVSVISEGKEGLDRALHFKRPLLAEKPSGSGGIDFA